MSCILSGLITAQCLASPTQQPRCFNRHCYCSRDRAVAATRSSECEMNWSNPALRLQGGGSNEDDTEFAALRVPSEEVNGPNLEVKDRRCRLDLLRQAIMQKGWSVLHGSTCGSVLEGSTCGEEAPACVDLPSTPRSTVSEADQHPPHLNRSDLLIRLSRVCSHLCLELHQGSFTRVEWCVRSLCVAAALS